MALSPMMTHYLETKKQYPDCILFYRLGDFYEMFFEDAQTVSKELELTLTGKDCGLEERAPMCGVPYHAVEGYLSRLVQKGYKVAIAEQMEDPKQARGLVKREVIRVVTPGTLTNSQVLEESKNNYLMGIVYIDGVFGVSTVDVSTGDYLVTEVRNERSLLDEIYKFSPSELICNEAFYMSGIDLEDLKVRLNAVISALENRFFSDDSCRRILREHFHVEHLEALGLADYETGAIAAGAVLQYLYETQKNTLEHLTRLTVYTTGQFMMVDYLIKVKGIPFTQAAEIILGREAEKPPVFYRQKERRRTELLMPELSETTEQVEKYLYSRGIHPVIIRYCLDNKLLFESADYHNAVFVGYDKDGKARYGALRSTVSSYKGELTGSDKHFSFFLEGKPNAEHIHVFESAIDLLSFATLTLLAGRDWKSETYLSLAGVFQTKRENVVPVALSRFLDEHPSVRKIHLHLDNDAVGRGAVKGIVGGLQGKYQVYDEPPAHGKDVNDELKIRVGLMRERKERERT